MKTVLLTNGQLRKTLAAARSLGRRGVPVIVADTTRIHPAGFSKYVRKSLIYPDPRTAPEAFLDWLERTVERERIDIVFPMDDDTLEAAMAGRSRLEALCAVPLPPEGSYRIAADKGSATRRAAEAGVACPRTAQPRSFAEAEAWAARFEYPAVIKPRFSSGSRGIRVARDPAELMTAYRAIHERFPWPLIQEFVPPGERFDVCFLYDGESGAPKAVFAQKELRHFPVERGPSTAQESVVVPALTEAALAIMDGLPWRGVVELEFMVDPRDGVPKFMEINPRFWNSLQMAVTAGIDFPWLQYLMCCGEPLPPPSDYAVGLRCRWLLPGDMLHFLASKERFRMEPPLWAGRRSGMTDDTLSADDPLPTLGLLLACCKYAADPGMWKSFFGR